MNKSWGVAVILKAQKERKKNFLSELKILIWGGGNEFLTALFVNGRFAKKTKPKRTKTNTKRAVSGVICLPKAGEREKIYSHI